MCGFANCEKSPVLAGLFCNQKKDWRQCSRYCHSIWMATMWRLAILSMCGLPPYCRCVSSLHIVDVWAPSILSICRLPVLFSSHGMLWLALLPQRPANLGSVRMIAILHVLHQKLLGGGFSTPCPLFCLICAIISNKTGHFD